MGRFHANVFHQDRGEAAVLRVIPTKILDASTLGFNQAMVDLDLREPGLVLLTGPTGSGESKTLAAMIDHWNRHEAGHIIGVVRDHESLDAALRLPRRTISSRPRSPTGLVATGPGESEIRIEGVRRRRSARKSESAAQLLLLLEQCERQGRYS